MTEKIELDELFTRQYFPPLTKDLQTRPSLIIEQWLDDVELLLVQWNDGLSSNIDDPESFTFEDALLAYDLLAQWSRSHRQIDPSEEEEKAEQAELFRQLDQIVQSHHSTLCKLAIAVPNTEVWCEEVTTFAEERSDKLTDLERARETRSLLTALDDVQLVAYALECFESNDADELWEELLQCNRCLLEYLDIFIFADTFIRLTVSSFSLEKLEISPDLFTTATKWISLLDILEEWYEELELIETEPVQVAENPYTIKEQPDIMHFLLIDPPVLNDPPALIDGKIGPERDHVLSVFQDVWANLKSAGRIFTSSMIEAISLPDNEPVFGGGSTQEAPGKEIEWVAEKGSWKASTRLPSTKKATDDCEVRVALIRCKEAHSIFIFGHHFQFLETETPQSRVATVTMGELRAAKEKHPEAPSLVVVMADGSEELGILE